MKVNGTDLVQNGAEGHYSTRGMSAKEFNRRLTEHLRSKGELYDVATVMTQKRRASLLRKQFLKK